MSTAVAMNRVPAHLVDEVTRDRLWCEVDCATVVAVACPVCGAGRGEACRVAQRRDVVSYRTRVGRWTFHTGRARAADTSMGLREPVDRPAPAIRDRGPQTIPPGARGINARAELARSMRVPCRDCGSPADSRCHGASSSDGETFYTRDVGLVWQHSIRRADAQYAADLLAAARQRLVASR